MFTGYAAAARYWLQYMPSAKSRDIVIGSHACERFKGERWGREALTGHCPRVLHETWATER